MHSNSESEVSTEALLGRYNTVRQFSESLCKPLEIEDYMIQSMTEASPVRWHLAHTSWFFETFLLKPYLRDYESPDPIYNYLFNSYYNAVGKQFPRPLRGTQSRPTVKQVFAYRKHVDTGMHQLLAELDPSQLSQIESLVTLGLNHEHQHQELMLTDLKHGLSINPLYPAYHENRNTPQSTHPGELHFIPFSGGRVSIGHDGKGFAFDNEGPRHERLIQDFSLANRLVTNGEYLNFISDGGYRDPRFWLSDGWATIQSETWDAPLYWVKQDGSWFEFTLSGLRPLALSQPVSHVSFYEADAYATWANCRLSTEFEWETAAGDLPVSGNTVEKGIFHPASANPSQTGLTQMFGDVWEWTMSPYTPYPGFKIAEGAVGEYNGKFMSSQMVLRGGSCVSSQAHLRASYRNFFYPQARWQFMGIRLAKDIT